MNFEAIFHSLDDGIITVDKKMSVVEINKAAERICGIRRDEVIGRPLRQFSDRCGLTCLDALKEALKSRKVIALRFVECRIRINGTKSPIVCVKACPLVDVQGLCTGAILVVRDVTHMSNRERRARVRQKIDSIVSRNAVIEKVRDLVHDIADVPSTVLIVGESGTGKELIVDALHQCGKRRKAPLIKVNCAAMPENLLESELFGHVAGAFTGALKNRMGRFQMADGGTIFLDEIGDISPYMQLRLLRVIETMTFERVGESTPVKVDVRIVAATNRNLPERVAVGAFRKDLYYRLKVVQIHLPPLRERREDIPLLIEHFRRKFNLKFGRDIKGFTSHVGQLLFEYAWPGNVRELKHLLEHAFVRCSGSLITAGDLPDDFLNCFKTCPTLSSQTPEEEAEAVCRALEQAHGNKTAAARLLGVSRRTIYRKLKKYKIE